MAEVETSERVTIGDFIKSPAYPFQPGSDPDLFAQAVAQARPDMQAEVGIVFPAEMPVLAVCHHGESWESYLGIDIEYAPEDDTQPSVDSRWRLMATVGELGIVLRFPFTRLTPEQRGRAMATLRVFGVLPYPTELLAGDPERNSGE